jgi:hypothetical protein
MAVSKITVMALVGILAVPILLGYAFNLSEVTETDYRPDGESVNVTPLLQTGTAYTPASADVFKINTDFEYRGTEILPVYNNLVSYKTSLIGYQTPITIGPNLNAFWRANSFDTGLYVYVGPGSNVQLQEVNTVGNTVLWYVDNLVAMHYIASEKVIVYQTSGSASFHYLIDNDTSHFLSFKNLGGSNSTIYYTSQNGTSQYIDISGGYKFYNLGTNYAVVNLPEKTKSMLMSIDLNSITDSNYNITLDVGFVRINLNKTTIDGIPKWSVTNDSDTIADELYYDTSRASNTYQFYYSLEYAGIYIEPGIPGFSPDRTYYEHNSHVEFRYVGDWPTLIGAANSYLKYEYDKVSRVSYAPVTEFDRLNIFSTNGVNVTPTIRMDGATFSAFAYSIISDATYTPGDFKTNPTTTLTVEKPGTSFEFAGNTYTVDNTGNITLGTHKVSVNGLKLESVPVPVGYENRINGNVVSVTAEPSTIKFNGQWGASVSTISNTATTYTKTEWTPGDFAWNGVDDNFLMVALITTFGVFIALGIYVRRTGRGLIPLLIVCGCAAALFICMI